MASVPVMWVSLPAASAMTPPSVRGRADRHGPLCRLRGARRLNPHRRPGPGERHAAQVDRLPRGPVVIDEVDPDCDLIARACVTWLVSVRVMKLGVTPAKVDWR